MTHSNGMDSLPGQGGAARAAEPCGYFIALNAVADVEAWKRCSPQLRRLRELHGARELVSAQPLIAALGPVPNSLLTIVEHPSVSGLYELLSHPEHRALSEELGASAPGGAWAARGVWPRPGALPEAPEPRAYVVSRYQVQDLERLQKFSDLIERLVAAHGGRFLVRIQRVDNLAGPSDGWYLSVVEFISIQQVQRGLRSSDLQDMASLRTGHGAIEFSVATAGVASCCAGALPSSGADAPPSPASGRRA